MKKSLMAVLFALMLVLAACGGGNNDATNNDAGNTNSNTNNTEENAGNNEGNDNAGDSVDSAAAEDVYKSSCASCHGQDLSGGAGPDLTSVGSELSADDILSVIENGQGSMPGGLISGDDAQAVADWLASHK
ncbi:MAG TPA: c-type cytochrome [Candidatus Pseudogracilibacillus intestinigallinarum]|uniref:C-type cytochrome n=1 Tax=Candidatus Pseudogracilibacillus intestinigallinarum TaxID=2838742 RepID=A0A9D1PKI4_9BACI|nr:c-type cytochrome [Candidatus Pseudogracilibacillus intestinigallinarum]